MCGFAGFLALNKAEGIDHNLVLNKMADSIRHRGPDDAGLWLHPNQQLGFCHRRLAILDLSPAGHQPMVSTSGRYTMVFNGEIYNHLALRQEVEEQRQFSWRGHSDTETMLACFDVFGFEKTINKLVGMFALAVWDHQAEQLLLARDRLGEKPLYLGWCGQSFLFGSELKALRAHPSFDRALDRSAIAQYMRYSYVPAPKSIYASIQKLLPGSIATVSLAQMGKIEQKQYWHLATTNSTVFAPTISEEEAIEELHQHIKNAVKSQMLADVPLGAFLSGGVDSSLIVGIMQSLSEQPVKTFTIGFEEQAFNEATYAADVASHLGTEHHELILTAADTLAVVPKLAQIYDEPFADSSQIPTYLVCAMARQQVTVSLSGDGGDELFGGYSRYPHVAAKWQQQQKIPKLIRRVLAAAGQNFNPHLLNRLASLFGWHSPGNNPGLKFTKAMAGLDKNNFENYYELFITHLTEQQSYQLVHGSGSALTMANVQPAVCSEIEQMMLKDANNYMIDDILVKVDRAAMANSLESRVPLLDVNVVEYAFQMPQQFKYLSGTGKLCLRKILDRYVPRALIERPKKGFGVPLDAWLRGSLRPWGERLLDPALLDQQGYLNTEMVTRMWTEHQQGVADWHFQLWNILVFQNWLCSEGSDV